MVKNKLGGQKTKSIKRSTSQVSTETRKLILKGEGQEYAFVLKLLGDRKILALTDDNKEILCGKKKKLD